MPSKKTRLRKKAGIPLGGGWRRILVPIDFSKASLRALDVAVPLARDNGGRLFLLSVVEPAVFAAGTESMAMAVPDAVIARENRRDLVKIAKRFVPVEVPATLMVDRGRAFKVITQVAEKERIDLIVLTTHGRTGLDRFLMGSTAEQVVRHARCPVWVVRGASSGKR
jgi:nucleotide-binding universal stress UspA family protein